MVLGALCVPTIGRASQAGSPEASHPGWNEVVRLLSAPQRAIDAETVERLLGVTMNRRTRAVDDYDAWIPGRERASSTFVRLIYRPSQYKGQAGLHDSLLQIFVSEMECVSPTRMRDDLLRVGFTTMSTSTSSTTREYYTLGKRRSLRVTYPAGPTGANLQVWAINHHTTAEDRRCVADIYIGETG
jgi:hypothetical protein